MKEKCFECDKPATENHHVIPQSLGGTKTVPLCGSCHDRVHGWGNKRRDHHSELTKEGLRKAKERGVQLGYPGDFSVFQEKGTKAVKELADSFANNIVLYILYYKGLGYTLQEIADSLNKNNIKTPRNSKWYAKSVSNAFDRLDIPRFHDTQFYEDLQAQIYESMPVDEQQEYLDKLSSLT